MFKTLTATAFILCATASQADCTRPTDSFALTQDAAGLYVLNEATGAEFQPHLSAASAFKQGREISSAASNLPTVNVIELQAPSGDTYYIGFAQGPACM